MAKVLLIRESVNAQPISASPLSTLADSRA
jgi:hypothetical protein